MRQTAEHQDLATLAPEYLTLCESLYKEEHASISVERAGGQELASYARLYTSGSGSLGTWGLWYNEQDNKCVLTLPGMQWGNPWEVADLVSSGIVPNHITIPSRGVL